jgi:hypothetical protein
MDRIPWIWGRVTRPKLTAARTIRWTEVLRGRQRFREAVGTKEGRVIAAIAAAGIARRIVCRRQPSASHGLPPGTEDRQTVSTSRVSQGKGSLNS